jgi:hypothetical protein
MLHMSPARGRASIKKSASGQIGDGVNNINVRRGLDGPRSISVTVPVPEPDDPGLRPPQREHVGIVVNEERDTIVAHSDPAMRSVLHVLDQHWHGIRSATACLPGGKLGVSHRNALTAEETKRVGHLVLERGYRVVCFQGYSEAVDALVEHLHGEFGPELRLYVVTHVSTSQFEHHFEMGMLERIHEKVRSGMIARAGSVKPNFHLFHEATWPGCVINIPPDLSRLIVALPKRESGNVFIPVENTWRKNLYTQVIAAHGSHNVRRICLVNWPSHLERLMQLDKIQVVGFQALPGLLAYMRLAQLVTNASFSECQPMTQLEALSVGTPAIVGPLRLPIFSSHPLSELCEVTDLDDPGLLRRRFDLVLDEWSRDPSGLSQMIADFVSVRTATGLASYREFLEL